MSSDENDDVIGEEKFKEDVDENADMLGGEDDFVFHDDEDSYDPEDSFH